MRRMLVILLTLLILLGAGMARAEETTMSVMDTILSFKQEIPGKAALDNLAIRDRQELGTGIRQVTWRWEQGKFFAEVTFGATLAPETILKDTSGRFRAVTGQAEYPYLLSLPEHYDPGRAYPMLLFLHGIGERGSDPSIIADYGPFQYILAGGAPDMIVIAPQVEKTAHWVEDAEENEVDTQMARLQVFMQQMQHTYPIDESRIYLTGLSMGGRGAWKLACAMPGTFAAVAICCGRAGVWDQPEQLLYDLRGLADTPVWLFHGLSDQTVDPGHALRGMEQLLALNPSGDFRLTLYPAVGHDCYAHAYRDDSLYAWLSARRKN